VEGSFVSGEDLGWLWGGLGAKLGFGGVARKFLTQSTQMIAKDANKASQAGSAKPEVASIFIGGR
jgi:hypothetical protein